MKEGPEDVDGRDDAFRCKKNAWMAALPSERDINHRLVWSLKLATAKPDAIVMHPGPDDTAALD